MKCALPGMYGRVIPVKSSAIHDYCAQQLISEKNEEALERISEETTKQEWAEYQKNLYENIKQKFSDSRSSFDQIAKQFRQMDKENHK